MPKNKSEAKPQTRNTHRVQFSLYPFDLKIFEWYRDQLPKSQRNNSAALRALLLEVMDSRFQAGRPLPPEFEQAVAELS